MRYSIITLILLLSLTGCQDKDELKKEAELKHQQEIKKQERAKLLNQFEAEAQAKAEAEAKLALEAKAETEIQAPIKPEVTVKTVEKITPKPEPKPKVEIKFTNPEDIRLAKLKVDTASAEMDFLNSMETSTKVQNVKREKQKTSDNLLAELEALKISQDKANAEARAKAVIEDAKADKEEKIKAKQEDKAAKEAKAIQEAKVKAKQAKQAKQDQQYQMNIHAEDKRLAKLKADTASAEMDFLNSMESFTKTQTKKRKKQKRSDNLLAELEAMKISQDKENAIARAKAVAEEKSDIVSSI